MHVYRLFSPGNPISHCLRLGSHELTAIWHKCDEKRNSKFNHHFQLHS